ncbi:MAG: hypothetical protein NTX52_04765 [Planctomycetota bacterium]|nr:hypothetical protein [Planctomycetota bacterium]
MLYTKLLFVETDRHDPLKRILEKEYEIEGDVIHFDALIVKFDPRLVMDGKERAMYLWRRVYGEKMQPEQGFAIESQGSESARYADICGKLSIEDRSLFWTNIWALADDTEKLSKAGVRAIYGNVVYRRLRPGLIYIFKIDASGGLFYESVPAL